MRRRHYLWLVALLFAGTVATADERRPNVLVLISDDQRPDTLGFLNPSIRTPTFDALARQGTVFRRAVTANPICTPSRAELLTGCHGFRAGVLDFGRRMNPELVLWPQAMQAAGYHTWYVGKWHNDGKPIQRGYELSDGLFTGGGGRWWKDQVDHHGVPVTGYRGWIFQRDDGTLLPDLGVGLTPDISARFADAAIRLIRRGADSAQPFFLHVNFTAPHDPLLMPPGYVDMYDPDNLAVPGNFKPRHEIDTGNLQGRDEMLAPFPRTREFVRRDLAVYYAVISHLDEQVGRILAALEETGQRDNTLIVYSSDHGLAMGSHGLRGKQNMYEHTVGIPMILSGPGVPRGRQTSAQMYLRDLYPTICELAEVPIPPTVTARSMAPVLAGKADEVHERVFCYFRNFQRMVRTQRWKLIHYPQVKAWQLFDLEEDPQELHNLAVDPRYAEQREELEEALRTWQRRVGDPLIAAR